MAVAERKIGFDSGTSLEGWTGRLQDTFLSEEEMALIHELICAISPAGAVDLTVSKTPWRFIASIRSSGATSSFGEGSKS